MNCARLGKARLTLRDFVEHDYIQQCTALKSSRIIFLYIVFIDPTIASPSSLSSSHCILSSLLSPSWYSPPCDLPQRDGVMFVKSSSLTWVFVFLPWKGKCQRGRKDIFVIYNLSAWARAFWERSSCCAAYYTLIPVCAWPRHQTSVLTVSTCLPLLIFCQKMGSVQHRRKFAFQILIRLP